MVSFVFSRETVKSSSTSRYKLVKSVPSLILKVICVTANDRASSAVFRDSRQAVASMPSRCQAVIDLEGSFTKY
eukprot:scaffold14355_cov220-Ochromonas_danica.AAC.2